MDPVKPQMRRGVLFYVGAAGLLMVMVIEVVSVIGRHARIPLVGALEMAQAAIVPAACASMILASLAGTHAAVHLVTERLPARMRALDVPRVSALLAGLFFAGLCRWRGMARRRILELVRSRRKFCISRFGRCACWWRCRPAHCR